MNESSVATVVRFAHRFWPRRSGLVRTVDRVQSVLLGVVVVVGLALLPVALAIGSESHAAASKAAAEQTGQRHPATARLLADAGPATGTGGRGYIVVATTSPTNASWQLPDGTTRTGTVKADTGSTTGALMPIWLDAAGNPVDPPTTAGAAVLAGVYAGLLSWLGAVAVLAALFAVARTGLNRLRGRAWDREWALVEPGWIRLL